MPFACAVALSGRFGLDLDLSSLTDDEAAVCRRAIRLALETQDLVQRGELVRLVSPVQGEHSSRAALAHLSDDRRSAVVFAYQLEPAEQPGPALRLVDLDPDADHVVTCTDLRSDEPEQLGVWSGARLADEGLPWGAHEPLSASIWQVHAITDRSVGSVP